MSALDQPISTFDDTSLQVRVIGDAIQLIDPMDTPVVALLGMDGARSKFRLNLNGTKIEIIEDTMAPLSTTANHSTTITTSTLSFTVTDASELQVGHVIQIDSEYMVVSAVNTSSELCTVYSRSYGGTNATHAKGSTIYIVGMARLQGADVSYGQIQSMTQPYNYTQIFQKGVKVTRTQAKIAQYGVSDYLEYQADKSIPELARLMERSFFHGVRAVGSKTTPSSFGGIETFVTNNSSSITTTITKAAVDNLAKAIYDDGGFVDTLILPTGAANNLRNLLDSSSFIRVTQEETSFGMRPVTRINTQFYENVRLVTSRHCPAKKAYMVNSAKMGFYTFDPFTRNAIAYGGDWQAAEVVGEFSFIAALDKMHGWIVTTASAL